MLLALQLATGGLTLGAAAALSALGLVLTYRATGVLNIAQGAIATLAAYVYWQLAVPGQLPTWLAALIAVATGPLIGLIAERGVFRRLQRRGATTSEALVANLGLFTVIVAAVTLIWGTTTEVNIPLPLPQGVWRLPGPVYVEQFGAYSLALLLVLAGGLAALFRFTALGLHIRAVVDRRELAELAGVPADRVSAGAWALGSGFAALTGVLLLGVASGLNDYSFTLIVLETVAVAVIARLVSLPIAVVGGLGLYLVQAEGNLPVLHLGHAPWDSLRAELPSLALVGFLLLYRHLDEVGAGRASRLVTARLGGAGRGSVEGRLAARLASGAVLLVAVGFPLVAHGLTLETGQQVVALFVCFLGITAITGCAGYVTLASAGFAGLGALVSAKAAAGGLLGLPALPVPVATALAVAVCTAVGVATGFPALRRRGLILALLTLAVNLLLYKLVFGQASIAGQTLPTRWLPVTGERAFYFYELAIALGAAAGTRSLARGRLGRVLGALRDSEAGAAAVGVRLRRYKLAIFAVSAALGGLGGVLLTEQAQAFNPDSFQPLFSLFWLAAVTVAGLSYVSGAALAAVVYVGLDAVLGRPGASLAVIGLGALAIGSLPGGVVGLAARAADRGFVPASLARRYRTLTGPPAASPAASPAAGWVPSSFARRIRNDAVGTGR